MIGSDITCDMHGNEKKTKFCKETNCWERLCPFCVKERHNGHNVVDLKILMSEIRTRKEKNNIDKNKILVEYKKLMIDLDHLQKKFAEKEIKLIDNEKKMKANFAIEWQTFKESMVTQRQKIKNKNNADLDTIKIGIDKTI